MHLCKVKGITHVRGHICSKSNVAGSISKKAPCFRFFLIWSNLGTYISTSKHIPRWIKLKSLVDSSCEELVISSASITVMTRREFHSLGASVGTLRGVGDKESSCHPHPSSHLRGNFLTTPSWALPSLGISDGQKQCRSAEVLLSFPYVTHSSVVSEGS